MISIIQSIQAEWHIYGSYVVLVMETANTGEYNYYLIDFNVCQLFQHLVVPKEPFVNLNGNVIHTIANIMNAYIRTYMRPCIYFLVLFTYQWLYLK